MKQKSHSLNQMLTKYLNALGVKSLQTGLTQAQHQMLQSLVAEKITMLEHEISLQNETKKTVWVSLYPRHPQEEFGLSF